MPKIYLISYRKSLTKEGISPNEKTGVGLTNHKPLNEVVAKVAKAAKAAQHPGVAGWKVEVLFVSNHAAKKRIKRKLKDGGLVNIVRGEWESDGNSRWATPGCT